MISSISIRCYRGFAEFEARDLERVNLLVGSNNSGKTSVLEAIFLLASRGDPLALWQLLWRRGERVQGAERNQERNPELDVSHLFTGHEVRLGSKFVLTANNQAPERQLTFSINEIKAEQAPATRVLEHARTPSRIGLHITGHRHRLSSVIPFSRSGGVND